MQYWRQFTLSLLHVRVVLSEVFKVAFLATGNGEIPFQPYAPAINLALEQFDRQGGIQGHTINVTYRDDLCSETEAARLATELVIDQQVDAIFGSTCSEVTIIAGYLLAWSNTIILPQSSPDRALNDKETFSTVVRVKPSLTKLGRAVVEICLSFGWTQFALLVSEYGTCTATAEAIQSEVRAHGEGVSLTEYIRAGSDFSVDAIDGYLDSFIVRGRVMLICASPENQRRLVVRTHQRGLVSPDYVYILAELLPGDATYRPWREAEDTRSLYTSVKQLTMADITGTQVDMFYASLPFKLRDAPWYTDPGTLVDNQIKDKEALFLYDLTWLWLLLLNETLSEGGDPSDGSALFQKAANRRFSGLSGEVILDDLADRDPEFWLWTFNPGSDQYSSGVKIIMSNPPGERVETVGNLYWGTMDGLPPPAVPVCGFFNEFCPEDFTVRNAIIIGATVGTFLVITSLVVIVLYYKRRQLEQELGQMLWKINFEDVQMTKMRAGSVIGLSMKSMRSIRSGKSASSSQAGAGQHLGQMFAEVGLFKGSMVAVKKVAVDEVLLTREDLLDFKTIREMNHSNINPFIGASIDPPNICYLMMYCPKGSLQDIIEQDEITLDWMFKLSLLFDMVNVFGNEEGEYALYRRQLWTAPELLRMPEKPRYGSPKGDVYSYAIIAQELVYRSAPFFLDDMTPKECVQHVAAGETPPYRPELPKIEDEDINPQIVPLLEQCWSEDPADRPDMETLRKKLRVLNKGKKINIMDQMLSRMEAYTNNLEGIVASRTSELTEEKKKTDLLLYRMLPESVAMALKQGKTVDPEIYEEVSIYFSDIVGFTSISAACTPMQVVDLLNDLYTLFDDILDRYDVYKVETIGDAYMVASGLPRRNGDKHAGEIAAMALDLLEALSTKFRVRHKPELRMKLRSGFHTGPVASGVVGLTMPRYCLFGESVNIASSMESSGEALKVQCSDASRVLLEKLGGYILAAREGYEDRGAQSRWWLMGKTEM